MKKYSMETAVGIFIVIGLICVGYMTVKLGQCVTLWRYDISAVCAVYFGGGLKGRQFGRGLRDPGRKCHEPQH